MDYEFGYEITPNPLCAYKQGDRVRATNKSTPETHEFVVHARDTDGAYLFSTSGLYFYTRSWTFEKLHPLLPNTIGMLIRVTKFYGADKRLKPSWVALRTSGGWHFATDRDAVWTQSALEEIANTGQLEFEILHDPKAVA